MYFSLYSDPAVWLLYFSCSEKVAVQALKASDWQFEGAFDIFYSHSHVKTVADTRHLEELYNRYKGNLLIYYIVMTAFVFINMSNVFTSRLHFSGCLLMMN